MSKGSESDFNIWRVNKQKQPNTDFKKEHLGDWSLELQKFRIKEPLKKKRWWPHGVVRLKIKL